jgi:hypothetical protein
MRQRLATVLAVLAAVAWAGCAHRKAVANAESLHTAAETFFRSVRWNDLRGAAQMLAFESQRGWLDKALDAKDDENLKITDCEAEDQRIHEGGGATTEWRVTWHRMPSVTTRTDRVIVEWVERAGSWYVLSITSGPLPLAPAAVPGDAGR